MVKSLICLSKFIFSPHRVSRQMNFEMKTVIRKFQVSTGVEYQLEKYRLKHRHQAIHLLKVDLSDVHTHLFLNRPSPKNKLMTTEAQVLQNQSVSHKVVAAVNASFFETKQAIAGLPANLIIENGRLIRFGRNSENINGYNYQNQAFGIMPNGKARIGKHRPKISLKANGEYFSIFSIDDVQRRIGEMTMYTPNYHLKAVSKKQAEIIIEVAVENVNNNMQEIKFGTTIIGTVTRRSWLGQSADHCIPKNGFILSANGEKWNRKLRNIQVGDCISVFIDIDHHWKKANFVIGSGPYLVKDGEKFISMNQSSRQATSRSPRTAVGVSKDGFNLFLVTVDGRQRGYSEGMTIEELADYFISLGADQALNLDGGGSTTMMIQEPDNNQPTLINRPANGTQREISTTLQVIDTTPCSIN